jgi:hypothetical protein
MNTFNEIVNYINDLKSEKIKLLFDYYFLLYLSIYKKEYVFIKIFKYHIIILNNGNKPLIFKTYDSFEDYVINILLNEDKK